MASLTEDQKNMLNNTFGIDLDTIGQANYSVYHQMNYSVGPINLSIDGPGQIFSTEMSGKLICLALHGGNTVIKQDGCLLEDGFDPSGDQDVSQA
jgi:Rieske Fe-S protein